MALDNILLVLLGLVALAVSRRALRSVPREEKGSQNDNGGSGGANQQQAKKCFVHADHNSNARNIKLDGAVVVSKLGQQKKSNLLPETVSMVMSGAITKRL